VTITPEILRTLVPSARVELITDEACTIADELTVDDSSSLWLIRQGEKVFICPVVEAEIPRRAQAGDFIVNKLPQGTHGKFHNDIQVLTKSELALSAEQTNESVILDNTYILKWQLTLSDTQSHLKEQALATYGFPFTPPTRGHITYDNQLIASLYDYIPETTDGWTWCIQKAKLNDTSAWVSVIARITAEMHKAFEGTNFAHGDLHVGQFLNRHDEFYVIDFEGNPISKSEGTIQDVASLMCSFIHVGAVIDKKYPVPHDNLLWIRTTLQKFQYEYEEHSMQLLDAEELWKCMAEHEEVEAEYAEKYLPHWKYVAEFGKEFIQGQTHG
jgi:hypothetical protein